MSSWIGKQYSRKRILLGNNTNNIPINTNNIPINTNNTENKETIIKIITEYGFDFKILSFKPIPNAMGIGDLLFNILHLQDLIWRAPLYINIFYFTINTYYPNPINALKFRLDLLSDILSNHAKLNKKDIVFYYNADLHEQYNTNFKYDKLQSFCLKTKLDIPNFDDTNYIIFHTKLRLTIGSNYKEVKNNIREFCKKFKTEYRIYILGEQNMSVTEESKILGITTIYEELLLLKSNNEVIDLSIDNIYENLNYSNYKKDIGIIRNAKSNIHFGVGGQFSLSLLFAKNIVHYCPIYDRYITDIANNPNLKTYNVFEDMNKFTNYMNNNIEYKLDDTINKAELLDTNTSVDNTSVLSTDCLSYISGGRLGDFIFQLSVIHANYIKYGKKGILYIADIGDKFIKGIETAYNDTKDIVLKQNYIKDYKIYNGEKYDINLSSWRDIVFNKERNWDELFKHQFNISFGSISWINNIPINYELNNKILISFSLQRENNNINLKEYLSKYDISKLCFICLDYNEYNSFKTKTNLDIPVIHCTNLIDLLISINSCKLFIGNFSAPLTVAIALHKRCIGITPTNSQHSIDLVLVKNISHSWPHFTTLSS
jgi:hypothetical protein